MSATHRAALESDADDAFDTFSCGMHGSNALSCEKPSNLPADSTKAASAASCSEPQPSRAALSLESQPPSGRTQSAGMLRWIRQRGAQLSVAALVFLVLTVMHAFALLVFKLNAVDGSYPFSSASTVVVTEAVKLCLATALHKREIRLQPDATRPAGLIDSFRRTASCRLVLATCIVSAMYTGNNLLTYYCVAQMDPGTLAIAKSLVPYLTAIVLQLFGRAVNGLQWACIILQCTGVATTQYVDHSADELHTYCLRPAVK